MSDEDPFEDLDVEPLDPPEDGELDEEIEALFTEVEVGDVDDEAIWAELTGEAESPAATDDAPDEATDLPPADNEGTVVPKASYCQQCEYFSSPPTVACENAGTEIVELVDVEHLRVRNCPVVARRSSATRDISHGDEDAD